MIGPKYDCLYYVALGRFFVLVFSFTRLVSWHASNKCNVFLSPIIKSAVSLRQRRCPVLASVLSTWLPLSHVIWRLTHSTVEVFVGLRRCPWSWCPVEFRAPKVADVWHWLVENYFSYVTWANLSVIRTLPGSGSRSLGACVWYDLEISW